MNFLFENLKLSRFDEEAEKFQEKFRPNRVRPFRPAGEVLQTNLPAGRLDYMASRKEIDGSIFEEPWLSNCGITSHRAKEINGL